MEGRVFFAYYIRLLIQSENLNWNMAIAEELGEWEATVP